MKSAWSRAATFASLAGLGCLAATFASCATSSGTAMLEEDASSAVPDAGGGEDVVPGPSDASCDASDSDCTTELVSCDEVDWCLVPTSLSALYTLTSVWGSASNDVWAAGSGGTILHWDGDTWTETRSGLQNTFLGIWGSGQGDIWAVSSTEVVLHGTQLQDGGVVWENRPTSITGFTSVPLRAVWGSSADHVRIGGRSFGLFDPTSGNQICNQLVLTTHPDGGTTWRPILGEQTITSIWGSSASDVWITADENNRASERGKTLHGTTSGAANDGGAYEDSLAWQEVDSQATVTLESLWGSSASDVWAVGALGTIRHITSSDSRWQEVASPTTETLRAIWGSGPNDIWAVGDSGTILHYDGTSFKLSSAQLPLGKKPNLRGIWGSGPDDVWIVGDVVLRFTGKKAGKR